MQHDSVKELCQITRLLSMLALSYIERGMKWLWSVSRPIHTYHAVPMPCHVAKGLYVVFPIWFTQRGRVWFTHSMPHPCHATTMPFWKQLLKATAQRNMGMARHVWISIGRPETACGRPAHVRLLPATTRSSTNVVIRSIPIRYTVGLAVRVYPATTRTFTKDTALSENGRGAARHGRGTAWHVWISLQGTVPEFVGVIRVSQWNLSQIGFRRKFLLNVNQWQYGCDNRL
jgi:hypothetical protein